MFLKWNDIYSVNVKELDEQHQKVFEIINRIYEIKKNPKSEHLDTIIQELKDYGNYHLEAEEKYFEEFDYPDKVSHIQKHDMYREKVVEFEKKSLENDGVADDLSQFLRDWWINHIQKVDHEYSHFFNNKGLY